VLIKSPIKKTAKAVMPPIISVFKPDFIVNLLTTFPLTNLIEKKDMTVNIVE